MEKIFGQNDPQIMSYVENLIQPEDAVLAEIRKRCQAENLPMIQVGAMDARHLEVLARALNVKKAVEIGTLGGYSGVCIARALGDGGKLFTFEYEPHHAAVAKESFVRAGVNEKVECFVGPAIENLSKIEKHGPFDLVFIDADKVSYPKYFEWAAKNLRIGGSILADNTFGWGMITYDKFENRDDELSVKGLQDFNKRVASNKNFAVTMLPTGEGLTLAVRLR